MHHGRKPFRLSSRVKVAASSAVLCAGLILFAIWRISLPNARLGIGSLAQEREAAKRAGLELSTDALSEAMPPERENAAPLYKKYSTMRMQRRVRRHRSLQVLNSRKSRTPMIFCLKTAAGSPCSLRLRSGKGSRSCWPSVLRKLHKSAERRGDHYAFSTRMSIVS